MRNFSRTESATAASALHRWMHGLPDDVEALKALVIDLHGRAQEQERYIEQQREGLRILAHNVEALRKLGCEHHADLPMAGEQGEVRHGPHSHNGTNGSG